MRRLIVCLCFVALPAFAQRAPGAPTPVEVQAQIVRLQIDMKNNEEARRRLDADLREVERRANELRIDQQRLQNDYIRMQSELLLLQQQARQ